MVGSPLSDVAEYGRFRLVMLDHGLHATDGIREARRIRAAHPDRPLLLLISGDGLDLDPADAALFIAVINKGRASKLLDDVREVMRQLADGDPATPDVHGHLTTR